MSCELFVGNLNPAVRVRDLENCFGRYGKIDRCDLKQNFGFIQFVDRRDAEEAIRKENNRRLLGSVMTVEWAKGSVGDKSFRGGDKSFRGGGGGGRFRKPFSPPRFGGQRDSFGAGRPRSPPPRSRDRSPVGRRASPGFSPKDSGRKEFGGGRRMSGGGRDYDNRSNFDSRPPPRDRYNSGDRFSGDRSRGPQDRGNRGPPRSNGFSDRSHGGDRFNDRRESFGERRNFGSGPRRF